MENIPKTYDQKFSKEDIEREKEFKIQQIERNIINSGVPERQRLCEPDLKNALGEKLDLMKSEIHTGMLYALIGKRGTGKTQCAVQLIKYACNKKISAKYAVTMDFFMDIKETYKTHADSTEARVLKDYLKPQFLILDEIHERGESEWENRLLTHMIDKRYGALKDTILISNQTHDVFCMSIGNSILSRLNETGGIIVCNWESFRG